MTRAKKSALAVGATAVVTALITTSALLTAHQPTNAQQPFTPPDSERSDGQRPEPIASTHELMETFNKPYYAELKKSMAEQPSDEAAWDDAAARGLQAAEIANLVAIRDDQENHDEWVRMAAGLQRAGVELREAAQAQDWDATRQAYRGVLNACNRCHQARAPDDAPQLEP